MHTRLKLSLLAASLVASFTSLAASPSSAPAVAPVGILANTQVTNIPVGLTPAIQKGYHAERSFPAVSGLTGWVMKTPAGDYQVFYTTSDGQNMVVGNLVSAQGMDLTQAYTDQFVPKPDLTALWSRFEKASTITSGPVQGKAKGSIYAIMDPNCIFCHYLWIALKPYEAAGLQVHWIVVGFLHQDSAGKAAALLQGGDSVLTQSQEQFDEAKENAGVQPIEVSPAMKAKLDANLAIMKDAQVKGTPGIFFKDEKGVIQRRDGMPHLEDLPIITGIPAQKEPDPRMARFSTSN